MQPKRTALIWTAVLVCTFTVSPNSKAAPVPLDFIDTYSEVGVYAEAQVYGDVDGYGSDDYQDFWDASASAYAEGYITENDPPPPHEIPVYAQMDMDASLIYYDSTEYVEVFSSLYGYGEIDPMAYGGECYGQGDTLLQGQLTVGTSGSFPEGSGGLTLEVYADGYEYELYSDWGIHFFSDDPNNPIDETLENSWFDTLSIPVLAGQVLDVDFWHTGDGGGSDEYFDGYSDLYIEMTVVPEPATVVLLSLGGLVLRRKRRA